MTGHVPARLGVVTGGARGIGLAICRALLASDAVTEVIALDRDARDIAGIRVIEVDVTDDAAIQRAIEPISVPVHVLVNNVGGGSVEFRTADALPTLDEWRAMIELNLTSAYAVTRALGARLSEGGAICNVASGAGIVANQPFLHAYAVAKAGIIHWTRNLAIALAPRRIRVNAVAPGFVWTDAVQELVAGDRSAFEGIVDANVLLASEQTPEDIAHAVSFLCSDRAAQITGHTLPVDGGASIARTKA